MKLVCLMAQYNKTDSKLKDIKKWKLIIIDTKWYRGKC